MLKLSCSIMKLNSLSLSFKVLPTWYMLVQIPMRFHFSKYIPFFSCANMIKNPFTNYFFQCLLRNRIISPCSNKTFFTNRNVFVCFSQPDLSMPADCLLLLSKQIANCSMLFDCQLLLDGIKQSRSKRSGCRIAISKLIAIR